MSLSKDAHYILDVPKFKTLERVFNITYVYFGHLLKAAWSGLLLRLVVMLVNMESGTNKNFKNSQIPSVTCSYKFVPYVFHSIKILSTYSKQTTKSEGKLNELQTKPTKQAISHSSK